MNTPPGIVFTPPELSLWAAKISDLVKIWIEGGRILDPTCGEGSLLYALAKAAEEQGFSPDTTMVSRLYGAELSPGNMERLKAAWVKDFPPIPEANLWIGDFMDLPSDHWPRMDGILANPPWCSFGDLNQELKNKYRELFLNYQLALGGTGLLLGDSRVDLSALIWAKSLRDHLTPRGTMGIFAPLSLVGGTGAHRSFRRHWTTGLDWKGIWLWNTSPFPGIKTASAFYLFSLGDPGAVAGAVPWHLNRGPVKAQARPWPLEDSPWLFPDSTEVPEFTPLALPRGVRCRQGVNTQGANEAYLLDRAFDGPPGAYCYPLNRTNPEKWIFIPHDSLTGKPLGQEVFESLARDPQVKKWVDQWGPILRRRKGVLLGSYLKKGLWWALVGVGPYTFSPWKILWKSYGTRDFAPGLTGPVNGKPVIPFQALEASLGFSQKKDALGVFEDLRALPVKKYLEWSRMGGGPSGAQPGRMAPFFRYS